MDESLSHVIIKLVDKHLFIDEKGVALLNQSSLLHEIKEKHPSINCQQLNQHLELLELDLPSQLISEFCSESVNSLQADEKLSLYQIIKPLAQGGMGEVYLAKRADGQFDKKVALKILSKGLITSDLLTRFRSERQILANLRHPNIVPILDAGTTQNNRPWFVLEFIDGIRIDDFCLKHQLSHEQVIQLFLQVCKAIIYAHKEGVIHRDLKPANILVENNDKPMAMVLDFGIAQNADSQELTVTGQMIGTPGYMSPEQTAGQLKQVDHRSDVFALGVILFQLLSGIHPFKGDTSTETNFNVMKQAPLHLSKKQVDSSLIAVIHKCLHKSPTCRYQSVQELADDCLRYLNKEPVLAQKVTWGITLKAQLRKRPLVSLFTVLAVVVLMFMAGLLVKQNIESEQHAQQLQQYLISGKELEQSLRQQHMLPAHDLSATYKHIEQQIAELKNKLSESKQKDLGYIYATLGNAYLLLNQPQPAISAFTQGEQLQFDNERLHLQFALALAQRWEHESNNLDQIANKKQREEHDIYIQNAYLIPAQNKLSEYLKTSNDNTYLQAYLAYLNDDLELAMGLANQAIQQDSGLFEAHRLAGKAAFVKGKKRARDGQAEMALEAYKEAETSFEQAILIGRSDPLSYQNYCELLTTKMHADIISDNVSNNLSAAQNICVQSERVLPNQFINALNQAKIYSAQITLNEELQIYQADDAEKYLEYAQKALDLAPNHTEALAEMVWALIRISDTNNNELTQEEKNSYLRQAQKYAETSIKINDEDAYNWANLADIHYTLANRNVEKFDITPHVDAGVAAYQKSNELLPSYAWYYNIANLTKIQGDYLVYKENSEAAKNAYQDAVDYYQETVRQSQEFSRAWLDYATTYRTMITIKIDLNQYSEEDLVEATNALNRACQLYQRKGAVNERLTDAIKDFHSIATFKTPAHCL